MYEFTKNKTKTLKLKQKNVWPLENQNGGQL